MVALPRSQTPAFLQKAQWAFNPIGLMETNFRRFGNAFYAHVSPVNPDVAFLNHPEAIQYLLTHDNTEEIAAPGEVNALLKPLLGENSVILLSGKRHRQHRQLMLPPFHGERMRAYGELICTLTREVMGTWQADQPFSVRESMQQITMRVILQAVFGLYESDRYRRLEQVLTERLNLSATPLSSLMVFFPQLVMKVGSWIAAEKANQLREETDALLYAEIRERRANPDPQRTDILSLLLSARDEAGQGLTDAELHDELITLLVAGHETTATALTWALYWIHRLPEVRQKLLAELEPHRGSQDYSAIARLPYLNAVCNETLRIHPVAMVTIPRRAEKDFSLMGYDIPAGMVLMGSIYLVHHREELYPEPHTFRPERFLERQYSPYEFLPFGGGSRRCVGAALAMYEMTLILTTILTECSLVSVDNESVRPRRRGALLGPDRPVRLQKGGDRSAKVLTSVVG